MKYLPEYEEFKKIILPLIKQKFNKKSRAIDDILNAVIICLFKLGYDLKFVEKFIKDVGNDLVFNPNVFMKDSENFFDSITLEYRDLAREMFCQRPVGAGTPNAAIGDGELFAIISSPRVKTSKKKGNGDILIDDKSVEIKGDGTRIFTDISGKDLNKNGYNIGKKYGLKPNKANSNRVAWEPWSNDGKDGKTNTKENHWKNEFERVGKENFINFLMDYMFASGIQISRKNIENCFINENFNPTTLQKEMLKQMFATSKRNWDYFTIIDSEHRVRCINSDIQDFNSKVDNGNIYIIANYFRMFQDTRVGWYIRLK